MKQLYSGLDDPDTGVGRDKPRGFVGVPTTKPDKADNPTLPRAAHLPINRCSIPAVLLGSLTYQRHPVPLTLDGVLELHHSFFRRLDQIAEPALRVRMFLAHMAAAFSLDHPEEAGSDPETPAQRRKASYLRMLRGWAFDPNGMEGAVLKGWVESRFGLLPRHHGGPIRDLSGETYRHYLEMRGRGLYGTNAMEAQLDLLYTYGQYELGRRHPGVTHFTLYRGVNRLDDLETLAELGPGRRTVLLNNLSSFSRSRERADEFGDTVLEARVPLAKVFFHHRLLPSQLKGEDEFVVIGGVYEVAG